MKRNITRTAGIAAATLGLGMLALPFATGASATDSHTPSDSCSSAPSFDDKSCGDQSGEECGDESGSHHDSLVATDGKHHDGDDECSTSTPTDTETATGEPTDTETATGEPTDTETATGEPTDTSNPSDTDTSNPAVIPSTGGGEGSLAHTGSTSGALLGLGAALLATGAVFLVAGRRRPEHA